MAERERLKRKVRGMENLQTESILQFHQFQLKLISFERGHHLASWFVAINRCANGFTLLVMQRDGSDNSFPPFSFYVCRRSHVISAEM